MHALTRPALNASIRVLPARLIRTALLSVALGACTVAPAPEAERDGLAALDTLVYRYLDAPKPPPMHRSYTLTLTAQQQHCKVDRYGAIVSERTLPAPPEALAAVRRLLAAGRQFDTCSAPATACVGGSSESLSLRRGTRVLFEGDLRSCGGARTGTLCGALFAEIMTAVPRQACTSAPTP